MCSVARVAAVSTTPSASLPPDWAAIVDDAAVFPPGNRPLADAVRAYDDRRGEWYAGLVRSFVVADVALPEALAQDAGAAPSPLSVVIGGGAGSGDCQYCIGDRRVIDGAARHSPGQSEIDPSEDDSIDSRSRERKHLVEIPESRLGVEN